MQNVNTTFPEGDVVRLLFCLIIKMEQCSKLRALTSFCKNIKAASTIKPMGESHISNKICGFSNLWNCVNMHYI